MLGEGKIQVYWDEQAMLFLHVCSTSLLLSPFHTNNIRPHSDGDFLLRNNNKNPTIPQQLTLDLHLF